MSVAALFGDANDTSNPGETKSTTQSNSYHKDPKTLERAPSNFVGLENQGATCYMNSLLQTWFMTPEIRGALYSLSPEEELNVMNIKVTDIEMRKLSKSKIPRKVPLHLQKLFAQLQLSQLRSINTSELTTEGFGWKNDDARIQHDLDALNNTLIDAVKQSLRKTSGEGLTDRLLKVCVSNSTETSAKPEKYISKNLDHGFSIQIDANLVKNVPTLTAALDVSLICYLTLTQLLLNTYTNFLFFYLIIFFIDAFLIVVFFTSSLDNT